MTISNALRATLREGREKITARWIKSADEVYPFTAAGLLRSRHDAFANPVGTRSREAAELLFAAILDPDYDNNALTHGLEEFLRIRAVQDMAPDQAVGPVFAFKPLLRAYLAEERILVTWDKREELTALETRIDSLALLAFVLYTRCREALFTVKLNDMRRRNSQLLRFAQKFGAVQPSASDLEEPADI